MIEEEGVSLETLLDVKITRKPSKFSQKYRRVIPVDLAEIEIYPDRDDIRNIFSVTLGGKKGKTTYFSASSSRIKEQFIDALQEV